MAQQISESEVDYKMICKQGFCKNSWETEKLKRWKSFGGQTIQFDAFASNGFTLLLLRP